MTPNKPPLLIIRGDLRSNFGYGRALRSHAALIQNHVGTLLGVDLHYHPEVSTAHFPWPIIQDADAAAVLQTYDGPRFVLNYTTPDGFVRFNNAYNIGMFYWETDRYNEELGWADAILEMDAMWIPSRFMENAIREAGFDRTVTVIPWPHRRQENVDPYTGDLPDTLRVDDYIRTKKFRTRTIPFEQMKSGHKNVFLSITQNVARKGLTVLLSEWLRFKTQFDDSSALLIKLSSFITGKTNEQHLLPIAQQVSSLAHRFSASPTDVYLCHATLSEDSLSQLYRSCDALLAMTFGEGFGGTVVESGLQGTPVVLGSHTAVADFIPNGYPLVVRGSMANASLRGQLHYYPVSSRWFIPEYGELKRILGILSVSSASSRESMGSQLAEKIESICDPIMVNELIGREIRKGYETGD